MKIHDITIPIRNDMPVWPGDTAVYISPISQIAAGARSNVSRVSLTSHTGTHIDPPRHFIRDGATLDEVSLETLMGPADVVSLPDVAQIDVADLEAANIPADCERLLLRTRNSLLWAQGVSQFREDYVGVNQAAARWLVQRGFKLVGTDYLSVGQWGDELTGVHHILLGAGIILLEGVNLHEIAPGRYQLICLPLKLAQGDGAPVRAILLE